VKKTPAAHVNDFSKVSPLSEFGNPRQPSQPTPRQQVRKKLRARELVLGINPEFAAPGLTEFCARMGAELIFIDCEHGGPDMETVCDMIRAAHVAGAAAVVRPWSRDSGVLRRFIDAGIDGFIAPDIESAAQVQAIAKLVADCDPPDAANFLLITLIESTAGCAQLGEILATGLVDAVLVGSGDLAVSMGISRRTDHPDVKAATLAVLRQARAAGISAGAPLNRYGVKPTVDEGGNLVMFFVRDLLRDGLAAGCAALQSAR
jgi:4-hydroxy-2-oxoheptanedioate aldolase